MRIEQVEVIPVKLPVKQKLVAAHVTYDAMPLVLVRIRTDSGVAGVGEGYAQRRSGSVETPASLATIIEELIAPVLLGQSPFDIEKIMRDLERVAPNRLYAHCPVGDALYDLVARSQGVPLYQLLGGKYRDRVAMSNTHGVGPTDEVVAACLRSLAAGYQQIKLKIGVDPDLEIRNTIAVRQAVGDDVKLAIDANCGYTYDVALKVLRNVEGCNLEFYEQPLPPWDLEGLAQLARQSRTPIAADESLDTLHSAIELIRRNAARIFVTKHHKNGGLYYVRKIWNVAEAAGVSLFPEQHGCSSIGLATALHLCAATWHLTIPTEFEPGPYFHTADDLVQDSVRVERGHWIVPDGPGIGVEIDEAKLQRYVSGDVRVARWPEAHL